MIVSLIVWKYCQLSFLDRDMAIKDRVSHCNCLVSLTKYKLADLRIRKLVQGDARDCILVFLLYIYIYKDNIYVLVLWKNGY